MTQDVHRQPKPARDARPDQPAPGVEVAFAADQLAGRVVAHTAREKITPVPGAVRGLVTGTPTTPPPPRRQVAPTRAARHDDAPGATIAVPEQLLAARRADVAGRAAAEARDAHCAGKPAIAIQFYAPGCLAVAMAGAIHRDTVTRLDGLVRDLSFRITTELLVLELSGIRDYHRSLPRWLRRVRTHYLIAGVRVELHNPPSPLATELGSYLPTRYEIDPSPRDETIHRP